MKSLPTTVDNLRGRGIVTEDEIWAATDAYLADPKMKPYQFASGHVLDVVAILSAPNALRTVLADRNLDAAHRRTMVRTALILAVPIAGGSLSRS